MFIKNDDTFICENCGNKVEKLEYTSRNHCPKCLHSKHVDNDPGDRLNNCKGVMEPIDVEINSKKGLVIVHRCKKCRQIKRNISAKDDDKEVIYKVMEEKAKNN